MHLTTRVLAWLAFSNLLFFPATTNAQFSDSDIEFFESKIRPILVDNCGECHGRDVDQPEGGFSVASRAAMLEGGDTGPAIVPGKPLESLLVESINYRGPYEMPPDSKLDQASIDLLQQWVKRGAPWPEHDNESVSKRSTFDLQQRKSEHWCWQPITKNEST